MRQRPCAPLHRLEPVAHGALRIPKLNRFVTDGTQVLDDGAWMEKMNLLAASRQRYELEEGG